MKFKKYQSVGNDFVIIDRPLLSPEKVKKICDRHFGIGADGILFFKKSSEFDAVMKIMNSDGSSAKMCGNGLRCFVKYLADHKGLLKDTLTVKTDNGPLLCRLRGKGGEDGSNGNLKIDVSLGKPCILKDSSGHPVFDRIFKYKENCFRVCGISMGNSHIVCLKNEMTVEEARRISGILRYENPLGKQTNAEAVFNIDRANRSVEIIVNEYGAGYTLGCGTGGGAVFHALCESGIAEKDSSWKIHFPGGNLIYSYDKTGDVVSSGYAEHLFSGEI